MTEKLQYALQHYLNSLQVYCRLCGYMPPEMAIKVSRAWEKIVHPIIYWNGNPER